MAKRLCTQKYVHREFEARLKSEINRYEKEFGAGISFVEMSMYFAQFAKIDFKDMEKALRRETNGRISRHKPDEQGKANPRHYQPA